jgi:hypothetical protein
VKSVVETGPLPLAVLLAITGTVLLAGAAPVRAAGAGTVTITPLSNRADLISAGDAVLRVRVPRDARSSAVRVQAGSSDVTSRFVRESATSLLGTLDGLPLGRSTITAQLPDGRGARLVLTNHPKGGPIFSGPQIQPWVCVTADNGLGPATDAQCNAPTVTSYLYQPKDEDPGAYEPYDPQNPPDDVATTKTDTGLTVPYIIRVELGTLDRAIYRTMVLADPDKPWTATRPQPVWNRTVLFAYGGGCGTPYKQNPPNPRGPIFGNTAGDGDIQLPALLARGWMTGATGLNTLNQNCNPLVSAEAIVMLKEHIADTRGEIRRTITVGGSGGSVQQHYLASNYPGVTDAIVPTLSFPDLQGMTWDASDCYLTQRYFTLVSPHLWPTVDQQLAVQGKNGKLSCGEFVALFSDWNDPQNRGAFQAGATVRPGCGLATGEAYHPITNPKGPRCAVQDYQRNIWGLGAPGGVAPLPFDNTGVQYGLNALQAGTISPAQFVDINARIGGIDNEGGFTSGRVSMSDAMAVTFYRSGQTTDAHRLADVPILDVREAVDDKNPEDLSDMHQPYNTRAMRARLDAANGTHGNHVSWFPPPENVDVAAIVAVDRWLGAIAKDSRPGTRAQKVIRDRPADVRDTCWIDSAPVTDPKACAAAFPGSTYGGTARIAAGGPLTSDVRKCHLKPLRKSDYSADFTEYQWATLQATFPQGVCDWSRPSVGDQRALPWMTFATVGGQPLGPAPVSVPFGPQGSTAVPGAGLPTTGWSPHPAAVLLLVAAAVVRAARRARLLDLARNRDPKKEWSP